MGDRNLHVGRGKSGRDRTVGEGDETMHYRLRMYDDIKPRRLDPEKIMGLDHFQTLVHEPGGVNRDFWPHRPIRMGHCLFGGGLGNGLAWPCPKRSEERRVGKAYSW